MAEPSNIAAEFVAVLVGDWNVSPAAQKQWAAVIDQLLDLAREEGRREERKRCVALTQYVFGPGMGEYPLRLIFAIEHREAPGWGDTKLGMCSDG